MNSIYKFSDGNLGGLQKVYFAPVEDVDVMPAPVDGNIVPDITFIPAYGFLETYFTQGTGQFKEEGKESENGTSYQVSITGIIPKDRPELLSMMILMATRRFIVVAQDNNGFARIAGRPETGLRLRHKYDSQAAVAGRNAHTFEFYGEFAEPAPFYQASVTAVPPGCPTLVDLITSSTASSLKGSLSAAGKLVPVVQLLTGPELVADLTTGQKQGVVSYASAADVIAGYNAIANPPISNPTRQLDIYVGISDIFVLNFTHSTTVANGSSAIGISALMPDIIEFERLDSANSYNYTAASYESYNPTTGVTTALGAFPFTVQKGLYLLVTYTKTTGNTNANIRLQGKYKNAAVSAAAVTYESESLAVFAAMTGLDTPHKMIYDRFVKAIKAAGAWNDFDLIHLYAANNSTNSKINIVNPGTYNAVTVNMSPSPDFTANLGWKGDGVSKYINTQFNPTTAGSPKFTQNSAGFGIYLMSDNNDSKQVMGNSSTGIYSLIYPKVFSDSSFRISVNANNQFGITGATNYYGTKGMYATMRQASTNSYAHLNGQEVNSYVSASTGNSNVAFSVLKDTTVFSAFLTGAAFVGNGNLRTNSLAIYNAFHTYMTDLGISI